MPTLAELNREIESKSAELARLFEASKTEKGFNLSVEQVAEVNKRNDELTQLSKERDQMKSVELAAEANVARLRDLKEPVRHAFSGGTQTGTDAPAQRLEGKSLGELFIDTAEFKAFTPSMKTMAVELPGEFKTLMTTSAGWAPFSPRRDRVQLTALRRPVVADLIPQDPIGPVGSVLYMEETTNTNNAATVAEGGTKPESALAFTERTSPVRKIATTLPVTDEQLSDAPQLRAVIDNRLRLQLELTEETQLLTGSGVAPNLTGILNASGLQTQAKGTDPTPDAVYKAMTKVRFTGFAEPTGAVFHPNDWQDVRLLRTADGIYIWGNPADPGPERIWGLNVIVTPAITENTALVGDFMGHAQIFRREGIRIETSDSHSTFFAENKILIRMEERLAFVVYRGAAFCSVTGV